TTSKFDVRSQKFQEPLTSHFPVHTFQSFDVLASNFEVGVCQSNTSSPIDRAVPRIDRTAAATDSVLRSSSLSLAISSTCLPVTVPTLALFGSADPFAMLAARFSNTGAGGVFVMNE